MGRDGAACGMADSAPPPDLKLTRKFFDLVGAWDCASRRTKRLEAELAQAKLDEQKAADEMCVALVPDPKDSAGEDFTQWIGDGMIRFSATGKDKDGQLCGFKVHWRKEMSPRSRMENGMS